MAQVEPQYASDYDDRTTVAVKSVLVEIGQILGSYQGKFAVIGGAVPWLLLGAADMPHVGTIDADLSLDAEALRDGEYAQLVETLMRQGSMDMRIIDRVFEMEGGYVLDFSNQTFAEFFHDEFDVDIDNPRWTNPSALLPPSPHVV